MYMVTSGTHFNSQCCFDFGNAETSCHDTGNGHMDAIYFGSNCSFEWPICNGEGPWVQADLEIAPPWSGPLPRSPLDPNPPAFTIPSPNKPTETTIINPPLSGYRPMKKEGAIVLGTVKIVSVKLRLVPHRRQFIYVLH